VKYGQPVLEQRGADVTEFDTPELHQLIADMFDSMYAAKGVGLAAPQIGIGKRLAVIDTTTGEDEGQKIVLINPEIVKMEGSQKSEEGCLSLPTFREQVNRPKIVTVRAQDVTGKEFEMTGEDLLARAFLHETDHLNGKLYISHISALKRDLIRRKIRKLQKLGEWE
jgi:peptide deformylase